MFRQATATGRWPDDLDPALDRQRQWEGRRIMDALIDGPYSLDDVIARLRRGGKTLTTCWRRSRRRKIATWRRRTRGPELRAADPPLAVTPYWANASSHALSELAGSSEGRSLCLFVHRFGGFSSAFLPKRTASDSWKGP